MFYLSNGTGGFCREAVLKWEPKGASLLLASGLRFRLIFGNFENVTVVRGRKSGCRDSPVHARFLFRFSN